MVRRKPLKVKSQGKFGISCYYLGRVGKRHSRSSTWQQLGADTGVFREENASGFCAQLLDSCCRGSYV